MTSSLNFLSIIFYLLFLGHSEYDIESMNGVWSFLTQAFQNDLFKTNKMFYLLSSFPNTHWVIIRQIVSMESLQSFFSHSITTAVMPVR